MSSPPQPASFEDAVSRLEEIVSSLETGNLSLDECLKRFEAAVGLSRFCAATLESAEKQIRVLSGDGATESADDLPWVAEVPAVERTRKPAPAPTIVQSNFDWDA